MILRLPSQLFGEAGKVDDYQLLPLAGDGRKSAPTDSATLGHAEQRKQRLRTLSKRAFVLGVACLLCIAVLLRVSKRSLTFQEEAFSNAVKAETGSQHAEASGLAADSLRPSPTRVRPLPTSLGGQQLIAPPTPTTPLPPATDNVYGLATPSFEAYISELKDFVRTEFPSWHAASALALLEAHLDIDGISASRNASAAVEQDESSTQSNGSLQSAPYSVSTTAAQIPKQFWQTDKRLGQRISWGFEDLNRDQGWAFNMLHDDDIATWALRNLGAWDLASPLPQINGTLVNRSSASGPDVPTVTTPPAANRTSGLRRIWDRLSQPILHADLWRYLILTIPTYGGIYSDSDTHCLKPFAVWGQNAKFWSVPNLSAKQVMRPPSVILAVEADVGTNEEWFKWWARPLQFVQWTMASAPGHPIYIDLLRRIKLSSLAYQEAKLERQRRINMLRAEAGALQTRLKYKIALGVSHTQATSVRTRLATSTASAPAFERREWLLDILQYEATKAGTALSSATATSSSSGPRPTDAAALQIFETMESLLAEAALLESSPLVNSETKGELSIMELTGPGVWTDAVINYFKVRYELDWTHFKDLEHPVRIGEIAVLPRTAFSPGVSTPGFGSTWDEEAMVFHEVSGQDRGSALCIVGQTMLTRPRPVLLNGSSAARGESRRNQSRHKQTLRLLRQTPLRAVTRRAQIRAQLQTRKLQRRTPRGIEASSASVVPSHFTFVLHSSLCDVSCNVDSFRSLYPLYLPVPPNFGCHGCFACILSLCINSMPQRSSATGTGNIIVSWSRWQTPGVCTLLSPISTRHYASFRCD